MNKFNKDVQDEIWESKEPKILSKDSLCFHAAITVDHTKS